MKKSLKIFLTALVLTITTSAYPCTSAIISGKLTPDGRPLLWKHRDTGEDNNRVQYFKTDKYNFIGLVNSNDSTGIVWAGTNSVGFSIINTASYNLKDDNVKEMDMEGHLMFKALTQCKTIADFEKFLEKLPRPMRVEANFGVIDSEGGAAYYEVNNTKFTKVDVNDPKVAPLGYLVYTNFSYTGRYNQGMGYIRYQNANNILMRQSSVGEITPEWIYDNLSRSYYHSILNIDLKNQKEAIEKSGGWFIDQDFIPRKTSTASIVFKGVKKGEDPLNTVMWAMIGFPPTAIAVPLWVKYSNQIPSTLQRSKESENAYACTSSVTLKWRLFPITRGNGNKYFRYSLITNSNQNGYQEILKKYEKEIFNLYKPLINDNITFNESELITLKNKVDSIIINAYKTIL